MGKNFTHPLCYGETFGKTFGTISAIFHLFSFTHLFSATSRNPNKNGVFRRPAVNPKLCICDPVGIITRIRGLLVFIGVLAIAATLIGKVLAELRTY